MRKLGGKMIRMADQYPPPPPPRSYASTRARPSIVTTRAMIILIVGIVLIIVAALEFAYYTPPYSYVTGAITVVLGVYSMIGGVGMLAGQAWALTIVGARMMLRLPEVAAYFRVNPVVTNYQQVPPTGPAASAPTCPTCGQPLTYIQQYQRWYCDNEKKYV